MTEAASHSRRVHLSQGLLITPGMQTVIAELRLDRALPGLHISTRSLGHLIGLRRQALLRHLNNPTLAQHAELLPLTGSIIIPPALAASKDCERLVDLPPAFHILPDHEYPFCTASYPSTPSPAPTTWSLPGPAESIGHTRLGILDTALEETHPVLRSRVTGEPKCLDLCATSPPAPTIAAHGTRIVSLLIGNKIGIAPDIDLRFAGAAVGVGGGAGAFSRARLLRAAEALAQAGCSLLNLSFSLGRDPFLCMALARLRRELGILAIAAAEVEPQYPEAHAGVLSVRRGDPPPGQYPSERTFGMTSVSTPVTAAVSNAAAFSGAETGADERTGSARSGTPPVSHRFEHLGARSSLPRQALATALMAPFPTPLR